MGLARQNSDGSFQNCWSWMEATHYWQDGDFRPIPPEVKASKSKTESDFRTQAWTSLAADWPPYHRPSRTAWAAAAWRGIDRADPNSPSFTTVRVWPYEAGPVASKEPQFPNQSPFIQVQVMDIRYVAYSDTAGVYLGPAMETEPSSFGGPGVGRAIVALWSNRPDFDWADDLPAPTFASDALFQTYYQSIHKGTPVVNYRMVQVWPDIADEPGPNSELTGASKTALRNALLPVK